MRVGASESRGVAEPEASPRAAPEDPASCPGASCPIHDGAHGAGQGPQRPYTPPLDVVGPAAQVGCNPLRSVTPAVVTVTLMVRGGEWRGMSVRPSPITSVTSDKRLL